MKSNFIGAAVVAVAALTSVAASAEAFNPFLWEQMNAPSTRTRAEVKAEVLQARKTTMAVASDSAYNGVLEQQKLSAPMASKAGAAPQAAANLLKTSQQ